MAYNPFNIFRRNQKALFAVLTVFIMIMFTLSFGRGDFFERIPQWLGASRGEALAKIDGTNVTSRDLHGPNGLNFRRRMANRFMAMAANQAVQQLALSIRDQHGRVSGQAKQTAEIALQVSNLWLDGRLRPEDIFQMPALAAAMSEQIESKATGDAEKEVARSAQALFLLIHKVAMGGGGHYFLNAPNRNDRDMIEFMLWEKKADQFGIRFTREDVNKMIQTEFHGFHKSDVEIRKALSQSMQGFTIESCLDAIATEFKVRTAQTAVLGQLGRFNRAPTYSTPFETFEFYRDQTSPSFYDVVPVPVAAFTPQVTGDPTQDEINTLYTKYGNDEPNPKNEAPGFKEPRKIAVGYIGITGEEPYYKKLAEEQIQIGEKMAKASGALTVPLPGAVATWAIGAVAPLTLKEPAIDAAYSAYTKKFKNEVSAAHFGSSLYARDILSTNVVKPGVLASTLGGIVGQTAGFGHPVAAVSLAMGAPIAYELRERVKVGMPLVLGVTPGPAMFPRLVGGAAVSQFLEPKPLPVDYMRPELIKEAIAARAKVLAFGSRPEPGMPPGAGAQEKGDVQRFIEELGKLSDDGKPKDKAAVEKYIQEFITSRGLTHFGKSTQPHDEWTLEDDPGLLPLVLAQKESLRPNSPFHTGDYTPFGQSFFWTSDFDRATFRPRRGPAATGLYKAQTYPPMARDEAEGKPHYIVWRTDDLPPKKLIRDLAVPAIKAAWKRMKARELAQNYANAMAEKIRAYDKNDPLAVTTFLADQVFELQTKITDPKVLRRAKKFSINEVAPLVPSTNPLVMMQGGGQTQPFELRESENLPFPTPEMRTALLDNRDKPPRTVLVLPDAPKDVFYVTTLIRRDPKSITDFKENVFSSFGRSRDIRARFMDEAMRRSQQSVLDLLKKEFRYEETEEQKKKLDENAKSGNRDRD
jgi:hypothetical protein